MDFRFPIVTLKNQSKLIIQIKPIYYIECRLYRINRCSLAKNRGQPLIRVYDNNEGKDQSYKPRNRSLQEYFLSHFISPTAHFQITKQNYQNWLLIFHPVVVQTWCGL